MTFSVLFCLLMMIWCLLAAYWIHQLQTELRDTIDAHNRLKVMWTNTADTHLRATREMSEELVRTNARLALAKQELAKATSRVTELEERLEACREFRTKAEERVALLTDELGSTDDSLVRANARLSEIDAEAQEWRAIAETLGELVKRVLKHVEKNAEGICTGAQLFREELRLAKLSRLQHVFNPPTQEGLYDRLTASEERKPDRPV